MRGQIIVEPKPGTQQAKPAETPKAETQQAKPAETAKAEPSKEDIAQDKQVFQSFCSACHGPNAQGAFGPPLAGHTRAQIVAKVRGSKGKMPPFSEQQLSNADLDKIVKFIESLSK